MDDLTRFFDYHLPSERIAQEAASRGTARMLVVDRREQELAHRSVADLGAYLRGGDLLLLNDTRVLAARVFALRQTGRRFELLLLRPLNEQSWEGLLRPSSRARKGECLELSDGGSVRLEENLGEGQWRLQFDSPVDEERLQSIGAPPLPPYIDRPDGPTAEDRLAYQTVFAREAGAVAAPTAGLHFTEEMLEGIRQQGAETRFVTLHVGIGTFRPVSVEHIADHRMHYERFNFSEECAEAVNRALAEDRRVVCVGTTSVRALEAGLAAGGGRLKPGWDETDIFITPGYRFRGVGAMLTNFHLPRSTLLMLVSALAGRERVLAAYAKAVERNYRFYSFGDAMLVV